MKYNELKEKLEGYLLENVNELMVLIDDICSYNYKSKLEYLQAYSMDEINEFACNYDFTDLFQMIDFKEFTIDDDYFNFKKITPQSYPQFFKNNPEYTFNNFRESLRKIYGSSILKLNTAEDLYLFLAAIENNKNKRTAEEIINDIYNINKYVYYQVTDVNNGKIITEF